MTKTPEDRKRLYFMERGRMTKNDENTRESETPLFYRLYFTELVRLPLLSWMSLKLTEIRKKNYITLFYERTCELGTMAVNDVAPLGYYGCKRRSTIRVLWL